MPLMPFHLPKQALHGLLSFLPLAAGVGCLILAADRWRTPPKKTPGDGDSPPLEPVREPDSDIDDLLEAETRTQNLGEVAGSPTPTSETAAIAPWRLGLNLETGLLVGGLGLIGWSLGGGRLVALAKRKSYGLKPRDGENVRLERPDGTVLHVETYGPDSGPPIVFVHGLGSDCDEWFEIRKRLVDRGHRVIDWDLAGLGESTPPADGDWSLDRSACDLEAVLEATCDRPAILLGHSLGGMIALTYCRLFSESLRRRVAGLVLAHTTYTNPMKTNAYPILSAVLQKPLVEPLCHLTIQASSLLYPLSVLSYLSGEAHHSLATSLFTGSESQECLDFLAGYFVEDRPEAIGRYCLAMLEYDETATLKTIDVPTLVVVGDRDDSCTPATHRYLRDHIPGARLMTLSPAKHGGLLEHPTAFTAALEAFAAQCAARRADPSLTPAHANYTDA